MQPVLVLSQLRRQDLYGHGPPKPCVFSPIHFPHAADTQQTANLVDPKLFPYQTSIGPFCRHLDSHLQCTSSAQDLPPTRGRAGLLLTLATRPKAPDMLKLSSNRP